MQLFVAGYRYQVRQKRERTLHYVSWKQFAHFKNVGTYPFYTVWQHWNKKKNPKHFKDKTPPHLCTDAYFFSACAHILSRGKKSRKQRPGCQVCRDYTSSGTLCNCDLFVELYITVLQNSSVGFSNVLAAWYLHWRYLPFWQCRRVLVRT